MTEKEIKNAARYWMTIAKRDYETMLGLFRLKRYPECLFFGHIVLEKVLKAMVVTDTKKQPLLTHDLVRLSKLTNLEATEEEIDLLDSVNDFNIRARYPEYKLKIYKTCTKEFTNKKLFFIKKFYKKVCQKIQSKKL